MWIATVSLKHIYSSSKIYTITNLLFIPVGHAVTSLFCFGWPKQYIQNLSLNAPISLIGTAIGSVLTHFLDRIGFDGSCYRLLKSVGFMKDQDEEGNMFTNLAVMVITGIWGYVLSNFINSSPKAKKGRKEL